MYLGALEVSKALHGGMKERILTSYHDRLKKQLGSKLSARNLTMGINCWAVASVCLRAAIVDCTKEDLQQFDSKMRILLSMHGWSHSNNLTELNTTRIPLLNHEIKEPLKNDFSTVIGWPYISVKLQPR